MSTRVDINASKGTFDEHVAQHHCRPAAMLGPDEPRCLVRVRLWQDYMAVVGKWGTEPGDAAKVTAQYAWQTELLGQRVTA
jgi:hypothetical protein